MKIGTVAMFTVTALILVACGRARNTLTVSNHTEMTATRVIVTVCTRDYEFTDLKPQESKSLPFIVDSDSGFIVNATLADGISLSNGFGYVTGGAGSYGNRASIEITRDRQIIGKQE